MTFWWEAFRGEFDRTPLIGQISAGEDQTVFLETGCAYQGHVTGGKPIFGRFDLPRMGHPTIVRSAGALRGPHLPLPVVRIKLADFALPRDVAITIVNSGVDLLADVWKDRIGLRRTAPRNRPGAAAADAAAEFAILPVQAISVLPQLKAAINATPAGSPSPVGPQPPLRVGVSATLPADTMSRLGDGVLYDFVVTMPAGNVFVVAPHALYSKASWNDFGFIHATDLHIARRNASLRPWLRARGESPGADVYSNAQDKLIDLIHYANHLHDTGQLDFIMATGDLVDHVQEMTDPPGFASPGSFYDFLLRNHGFPKNRGNYGFLEDILRGLVGSRDPSVQPPEELRVPLFVVRGNHDYRPVPYDLYFTVDIGGAPDVDLEFFKELNLTLGEAEKLQGQTGRKKISKKDGWAELRPDDMASTLGTWDYYRQRFSEDDSFTVELGKHRLIMLDTGSDEGIPDTLPSWKHMVWTYLGLGGTAEERRFVHQKILSRGLVERQLSVFRNALATADPKGLVIVGMHAPPIEPGEFDDWMREVQHPAADADIEDYFHRQSRVLMWFKALQSNVGEISSDLRDLVDEIKSVNVGDLLKRIRSSGVQGFIDGIAGLFKSAAKKAAAQLFADIYALFKDRWPLHTAYFARGSDRCMLDSGIADKGFEEFMRRCTDPTRPVNLVLFGHMKGRVEYRVEREGSGQSYRYFTDFYTENPSTYYQTRRAGTDGPIDVNVVAGARPNEKPVQVTDHRGGAGPWPTRVFVRTPPYPEPLNDSRDPKAWWATHQPLLLQTAPLGQADVNQRNDAKTNETKPGPTFQGFRFASVEDGVIRSIRYVRLADLYDHHFVMPWEPPVQVSVIGQSTTAGQSRRTVTPRQR